MSRKGKDTKKKDNFVAFEYDGKEFKYSGRLYPDAQTETKKCTITPMSLTLNGVITIKGCRLMQTDDNTWINFPSWKDKKDEYQSYVYVDKKLIKSSDISLDNKVIDYLIKICNNLITIFIPDWSDFFEKKHRKR